MAVNQSQPIEIPVAPLLGLNTASQPTSLGKGQFRVMKNSYQAKLGSETKRPGSVPVTTAALAATIKYLTDYKSSPSSVAPDLLATSGTTLYKFNSTNTLIAQTMTNALVTSDVYAVAFTDSANVSVLFITDGGSVKQYDGLVVKNVVPHADDPSPASPNNLTALNALGPIYCWVHKSQLFISMGKDGIYYSKPYFYDYFPTLQFERFVRNNDYITGPGITYSDVLLIPMRRGWGLLTGKNLDNFVGNQFLNTVNGCIAARSIQRITKPNGDQTIVYLSDDGVYEVFDTGFIDSGSRQYSTRSLMKDKIDFDAVGFTEAEKKAAVSYFDATLNLYIMLIKRGATNYAYCMDIRNGEWYLWDNINGESLIRSNGTLYFAGSDKHLKKFDATLGSDWNESTKTTGTPVDWDLVTDMIAFEDSGFASYLDELTVYGKQFATKSSIDITITIASGTLSYPSALQNQFATWDISEWDAAVLANEDYTDLVGPSKRIIVKKKAFYFQIKFQNNRDELAEINRFKLKGRVSGG